MTDREMLRENYPGQYTTPEDGRCPVCRGPIDVAQIDVSEIADIPLRKKHADGRWSCPRGCDPRTLMRQLMS